MEGLPGHIPAPGPHDCGVSITDPNDPARRGWGTYLFDAQPQRAVSVSAPHPQDDLDTAEQAIETYLALRARTLLIAGADRDQNTALATLRAIHASVLRVRCGTHGGVGLPDGVRGDLLERRGDVASSVSRKLVVHWRMCS